MFALRWSRFSYERTPKSAREWLYDRLDNFISCTVSAPCSLSQVLTTICEKAKDPIRIELLSLQLQTPVLSRARVTFGSAWNEIDKIARNYPGMKWWISEHGGLTMDTVIPTTRPADFDEIAGRVQFEMRRQFPEQRRLSTDQYSQIAAQLENFKPLDVLPKAQRQKLVEWNQKNGKRAIRGFSQALAAKQPQWLHREILRALYRAHDKFKRQERRSLSVYA